TAREQTCEALGRSPAAVDRERHDLADVIWRSDLEGQPGTGSQPLALQERLEVELAPLGGEAAPGSWCV
ncbi:MAG TPA: hypothetical protein VGG07_17230, partial [Solirubrobacteraceae bacterium]